MWDSLVPEVEETLYSGCGLEVSAICERMNQNQDYKFVNSDVKTYLQNHFKDEIEFILHVQLINLRWYITKQLVTLHCLQNN